jgi:RNase P/RNase MRP subunit p29
MNPENMINHELIGLHTHIVSSTDPTLVSRDGRIVDESKETISILELNRKVMIPKANCIFAFSLPSGNFLHIHGENLRGTPEDRLKKQLSRSW